MNAHSSVVEWPGLVRIASGIATLPTSWSSAARETSSSSSGVRVRGARRLRPRARATSWTWSPRSGLRSRSARSSTSRVCRPTDGAPASSGRTCADRRAAARPSRPRLRRAGARTPTSCRCRSRRRARRARRLRRPRSRPRRCRLGEQAELVAAEPVRSAPVRAASELAAEPREQRVAGGVAEGVVVALEAVEVEEKQRPRAGPGVAASALEVRHQRATFPSPVSAPSSRRAACGRARHGHDRSAGDGRPAGRRRTASATTSRRCGERRDVPGQPSALLLDAGDLLPHGAHRIGHALVDRRLQAGEQRLRSSCRYTASASRRRPSATSDPWSRRCDGTRTAAAGCRPRARGC